MKNFFLSKNEAVNLLNSYRNEITKMQKQLDAVVSLAFLLGKYIDDMPDESAKTDEDE